MAKLREFEVNAIVSTIVSKLGEGVIEARKAKLEPTYQELSKEFQELVEEGARLKELATEYDTKLNILREKVKGVKYLTLRENFRGYCGRERFGELELGNVVEESTVVSQEISEAVRNKVILSGIGKGDLNGIIDSIVSEFKPQIRE